MSLSWSVGLFILAGLCEIGDGHLMWLNLREGKPWWYALAGGVVLILYGVIPTFQPAHFGRVYAAYGGCLSCRRCCGDGASTGRDPIGLTPSARDCA